MRNAATKSLGLIRASYRRVVGPAIGAALPALALWALFPAGPAAAPPGASSSRASPAPAAAPGTHAPSASALGPLLGEIRDALEAGAPLEELRAVRLRGTITMAGGIEGSIVTVASRAPRAMREVLEIGGTRQVTTLVGERGWIEDANGAVREATGDELVSLLFAHELFFHGYLGGRSDAFELAREGRTLRFRPLHGGPERVLEIAADGKPRLLRQSQLGAQVTTRYEDWRTVGGVRFPHRALQGTGDPRFDLRIETTGLEVLERPPVAIVAPQARTPRDTEIVDGPAARAIPIEPIGKLSLVRVQVNGIGAVFLLDSGAGATVIDAALADSLGLPRRGRLEARGVGPSGSASFVEVDSLALPGVRVRDQTIVAVPLGSLTATLGRRIDGILGYDFLSRFAVELDCPARILALFPPGAYEPDEAAVRVPLRVEANVPRVEGVLEGEHRGSFLLDLGNDSSLLLHSPFARERGLSDRDGSPVSIGGLGGTEAMTSITVDSFSIGAVVFRDVPALVAGGDEGVLAIGEAIGNVGAGLFAGRVIAFDYSEGALWVGPPRTTSASSR